MESENKQVSVDELLSEFLSAKTLRDVEGIRIVFVTTKEGAAISIKLPWRAIRAIAIIVFFIWPVIARGGPAVDHVLEKIVR